MYIMMRAIRGRGTYVIPEDVAIPVDFLYLAANPAAVE
jgi:hypothetical protein